MKNIFLSLALFAFWLSSYCQTVSSISILPASPTASDNLKVVATTSFPGAPCSYVSGFSPHQSNDTIILDEIYCYESGSGGCTSTDTFPIGQLIPDTYVIRFKLSSTNSAGPCGSLSYVLKDIGIQNFTVTSGTLGIAGAESGRVEIYPNPVSDFVTFSFAEKVQSGAEIKIFDASGAMVKNVIVPAKAEELKRMDVSNLPAGIYFYSITGKEKSLSGKLVIAD